MKKSIETYQIEGMHCASCVKSIENRLMKIVGIESVVVNLPLNRVKIEKVGTIAFQDMKCALKEIGFDLLEKSNKEIALDNEQQINIWNKRLIITSIFGIPLFFIGMFEMLITHTITNNSILIQFILTTLIILINHNIYSNGIISIISGKPNMNSLVALGTISAYSYSIISSINIINGLEISGFQKIYFESAGIILVFITLGRYFENRAKIKTNSELFNLLKNTPKEGYIRKNGEWIQVLVGEIKKGDEVLIKPGSEIPVDGIVIDGASFVEQSILTGEPMPIEKNRGDILFGSSINTSGELIMEATKVGKETMFSRIIELVEGAQNSKAPIQNLADKVAGIFVPVVIILAIFSSLIWFWYGQPLSFSINIFISVLIIACPCALGLATPTAVVLGTGIGAKWGIHYKSAEALQNINNISTIIFDKTGTLTSGKPKIIDMVSIMDEEEFIFYLGTVENNTGHPLANAIKKHAKEKKINLDDCKNLTVLPGKGVKGTFSNKNIKAGSIDWFKEEKILIPEKMYTISLEWEIEGKTVIHTSMDNKWIGMVSVSDILKDGVVDVIQKLKLRGLNIYLLTGDQEIAAEFSANQLGIEKFYAGLLPHDKVEYVKKIKHLHGSIAMVGDGINDAPALAEADVGITIGSVTDLAMSTSDIVILRNDFKVLLDTFELSNNILNKIKQNLFWAFIYNIIGITFAMGLMYPLTGVLLNPMIAGFAMALSSVSIVVNTLNYPHLDSETKKTKKL